MPNENEKSIEQKLNQWLEGQGYPLEMETALSFQRRGFQVSLSDYYMDFETQETREIDVTATAWSHFDQPVILQVCFNVECKQSRDKPWVIFVPTVQRPFPFPDYDIFSSKAVPAFWREKMNDHSFADMFRSARLLQVNRFGYGITQAFTTSVDITYRAIMSSVKASIDKVMDNDRKFKHPAADDPIRCCVSIPVIVIEGKLFEYSVDRDQKTQLTEVNAGTIQWKGINPLKTNPLIHVVTKQNLDRFTDECRRAAGTIIALAYSSMEDLRRIALDLASEKES